MQLAKTQRWVDVELREAEARFHATDKDNYQELAQLQKLISDLKKVKENDRSDTAAMKRASGADVKLALHQLGFSNFRDGQQAAIGHVLMGKHVLVVWATGSGKSLVYQVPAIVEKKVVVVVSPLLALIQEQMHFLKVKGVNVVHLKAKDKYEKESEAEAELNEIEHEAEEEAPMVLFVTPEKLNRNNRLREVLRRINERGRLGRLVFDEAHCMLERYRADYKDLALVRDRLKGKGKDIPVLLLTATPVYKRTKDIMTIIGLAPEDVCLFLQPCRLNHIRMEVCEKQAWGPERHKKNRIELAAEKMVQKLKSHGMSDEAGIVYVTTRTDAHKVAEALKATKAFGSVDVYHAANKGPKEPLENKSQYQVVLTQNELTVKHQKWRRKLTQVMVATPAFLLGVDRPDVRWVAMWSIPINARTLLQAMGRAGRDGQDALCLVMYDFRDRKQIYGLEDQNCLEVMRVCEDKSMCHKMSLESVLGDWQRLHGTEEQMRCHNCTTCKVELCQFEDVRHIAEKLLQKVLDSNDPKADEIIKEVGDSLKGDYNGPMKVAMKGRMMYQVERVYGWLLVEGALEEKLRGEAKFGSIYDNRPIDLSVSLLGAIALQLLHDSLGGQCGTLTPQHVLQRHQPHINMEGAAKLCNMMKTLEHFTLLVPQELEPNEDCCRECGKPGTLWGCDSCPAAFHTACLPEGHPKPQEGTRWECPTCTTEATKKMLDRKCRVRDKTGITLPGEDMFDVFKTEGKIWTECVSKEEIKEMVIQRPEWPEFRKTVNQRMNDWPKSRYIEAALMCGLNPTDDCILLVALKQACQYCRIFCCYNTETCKSWLALRFYHTVKSGRETIITRMMDFQAGCEYLHSSDTGLSAADRADHLKECHKVLKEQVDKNKKLRETLPTNWETLLLADVSQAVNEGITKEENHRVTSVDNNKGGHQLQLSEYELERKRRIEENEQRKRDLLGEEVCTGGVASVLQRNNSITAPTSATKQRRKAYAPVPVASRETRSTKRSLLQALGQEPVEPTKRKRGRPPGTTKKEIKKQKETEQETNCCVGEGTVGGVGQEDRGRGEGGVEEEEALPDSVAVVCAPPLTIPDDDVEGEGVLQDDSAGLPIVELPRSPIRTLEPEQTLMLLDDGHEEEGEEGQAAEYPGKPQEQAAQDNARDHMDSIVAQSNTQVAASIQEVAAVTAREEDITLKEQEYHEEEEHVLFGRSMRGLNHILGLSPVHEDQGEPEYIAIGESEPDEGDGEEDGRGVADSEATKTMLAEMAMVDIPFKDKPLEDSEEDPQYIEQQARELRAMELQAMQLRAMQLQGMASSSTKEATHLQGMTLDTMWGPPTASQCGGNDDRDPPPRPRIRTFQRRKNRSALSREGGKKDGIAGQAMAGGMPQADAGDKSGVQLSQQSELPLRGVVSAPCSMQRSAGSENRVDKKADSTSMVGPTEVNGVKSVASATVPVDVETPVPVAENVEPGEEKGGEKAVSVEAEAKLPSVIVTGPVAQRARVFTRRKKKGVADSWRTGTGPSLPSAAAPPLPNPHRKTPDHKAKQAHKAAPKPPLPAATQLDPDTPEKPPPPQRNLGRVASALKQTVADLPDTTHQADDPASDEEHVDTGGKLPKEVAGGCGEVVPNGGVRDELSEVNDDGDDVNDVMMDEDESGGMEEGGWKPVLKTSWDQMCKQLGKEVVDAIQKMEFNERYMLEQAISCNKELWFKCRFITLDLVHDLRVIGRASLGDLTRVAECKAAIAEHYVKWLQQEDPLRKVSNYSKLKREAMLKDVFGWDTALGRRERVIKVMEGEELTGEDEGDASGDDMMDERIGGDDSDPDNTTHASDAGSRTGDSVVANMLLLGDYVDGTIKLLPPMRQSRGNRASRRLGYDRILHLSLDCFRVRKKDMARFSAMFKEGVLIAGRCWQPLDFDATDSKLRLLAVRGLGIPPHLEMTPEQYVAQEIPDCPENAAMSASKYVSRLALSFSQTFPTISIRPDQMVEIPDNEVLSRTDGCGFIRESTALCVVQSLQRFHTVFFAPSAYQVRIGGIKGVFLVIPDACWERVCHNQAAKDAVLLYRTSQKKYHIPDPDSFQTCFEVCCWSCKSGGGRLNVQLVPILEARGVPPSTLIRLQQEGIDHLLHGLFSNDPRLVLQCVTRSKEADGDQASLMIKAGFALMHPALQEALYRIAIMKLRHMDLGRVPVMRSQRCIMVPDPFGVLGKGQVFLKSTRIDDFRVIGVLRCDVVLCRSPCHLSTDVVKAKAVACPDLDCFHDVLVVNCADSVGMASRMAGGDYDGDTALVIWDPQITSAMEFSDDDLSVTADVPSTSPPPPADIASTLAAAAKLPVCSDSFLLLLEKYLQRSIQMASVVPQTDLAHRHLADPTVNELGVNSPEAIRLALIARQAIDAPKSGTFVQVPPDLLKLCKSAPKPHWMCNSGKTAVHSKSALGQLYDLLQHKLEELESRDPSWDPEDRYLIPDTNLGDWQKYIPQANALLKDINGYMREIYKLESAFMNNQSRSRAPSAAAADPNAGRITHRWNTVRNKRDVFNVTSYAMVKCGEEFRKQMMEEVKGDRGEMLKYVYALYRAQRSKEKKQKKPCAAVWIVGKNFLCHIQAGMDAIVTASRKRRRAANE